MKPETSTNMNVQTFVTLSYLFFLAFEPKPASACIQGSDCNLPDCFCSTFNHPDFTDVSEIPQMVYFGLDDGVTPQVDGYYQELFTDSRLNPNGCPITMSLYANDQYTIYSLVENNYKRGNEIGSHSVTHTNVDTSAKLEVEAGQQKENLINNGRVSRRDVVGWRSPNLQTAGDAQPDVLKSLNYTYDISLTYTPEDDDRVPWPYTLDFGYPYPCSVPPCPGAQSSHPGFWEIPVFSLMDPETGLRCAYVDSCRPSSEAAALNYLWTNFEQVYNSNKAPFGLNMHAAWFSFPGFLNATHAFLDKLLQLDDIYIISAQKVLDWMRKPVKVSEIPSKMPSWGCANPRPRSSAVNNRPSTGKEFPPLMTSTPPPPSSTAAPTTTTTTTTTTSSTTPTTTPAPSTRKANPTTPTSRLPAVISGGNSSCVQGANCILPSCQCRSTNPPDRLSPSNTPQIVYLTFSGRVDVLSFDPVLDLLTSRRNPNNCSLSATLFTPETENYVPYLQGLRSRGSEVGMYGKEGYKYTATPSVEQQVTDQLAEFAAQTNNIRVGPEAGGWHRGWRSPQDSMTGDDVLKALAKGGVLYDSSIPIACPPPCKDLVPWPYTLDFGFQDACPMGQSQCPAKRHPGLWEVPLVPLVDTEKEYTCSFVDACTLNLPMTAEETYKYLLENFDFNYNQNRAPFGVNLRRDWLTNPFYIATLEGLGAFFDTVLQKRAGVYVMSIEKMLDWMRRPTGLDQIDSFLPWKCHSNPV